jgi:hypothetical protein
MTMQTVFVCSLRLIKFLHKYVHIYIVQMVHHSGEACINA